MRVAVGGYQVPTNSFATQATDLANFQRGSISGDRLLGIGPGHSAIYGFLKGARERNWKVEPLALVSPPTMAGKATREAHEWGKSQLLDALRKAGRVDGVFMQVHGTGSAEHLDDCEGDVLAAIRELVGPKVPLLASLDGHANVTPLMAQSADMLIGVKTNPHSDFNVIGYRAADIMGRIAQGSVRPCMARAQPAMAPALQKLYIAPGWPMEHLMRVAQNHRRRDARILDVSLLLGLFVSERRETGMSVLVTTDGEPRLAADVASELEALCWSRRHAFHADMVSVEDAVREAMEDGRDGDAGPVVLGDLADSGGAGTPGDGTALLAELLKRDARGAVIGSISDPQAVETAVRAGMGAKLTLTVGAKIDRFHGDPVQISGRVQSLHSGVYTTATSFISKTFDRGPIAVIECGGIEVILTSKPVLVFEPNHFRSLGIDPAARRIIVCKAELQHRAGFAGIARKVIDVDAPGLATQVLSRLPYTKIRRPVFPLDDI